MANKRKKPCGEQRRRWDKVNFLYYITLGLLDAQAKGLGKAAKVASESCPTRLINKAICLVPSR